MATPQTPFDDWYQLYTLLAPFILPSDRLAMAKVAPLMVPMFIELISEDWATSCEEGDEFALAARLSGHIVPARNVSSYGKHVCQLCASVGNVEKIHSNGCLRSFVERKRVCECNFGMRSYEGVTEVTSQRCTCDCYREEIYECSDGTSCSCMCGCEMLSSRRMTSLDELKNECSMYTTDHTLLLHLFRRGANFQWPMVLAVASKGTTEDAKRLASAYRTRLFAVYHTDSFRCKLRRKLSESCLSELCELIPFFWISLAQKAVAYQNVIVARFAIGSIPSLADYDQWMSSYDNIWHAARRYDDGSNIVDSDFGLNNCEYHFGRDDYVRSLLNKLSLIS